jgi:hypothetical protein
MALLLAWIAGCDFDQMLSHLWLLLYRVTVVKIVHDFVGCGLCTLAINVKVHQINSFSWRCI